MRALAEGFAGGEEIVAADGGRPVVKLAPVEDRTAPDGERLARELEALRREGSAWRKAKSAGR